MKIDKSLQFFCRLITAIAVLGITAFFTPEFALNYLCILIAEVMILTLVDFFIGCFTKLYYHPYIKFIIGFVLSGISLYLIQYFIIGYTLSYIPMILGAIVFGLVDYILPSDDVNKNDKPNKHNKNSSSTKSNKSKNA